MSLLPSAVEVISASLPELYVEKLLEFLASSFEVSRHLEFYLIWTQKLLMLHGPKLKSRCGAAVLAASKFQAVRPGVGCEPQVPLSRVSLPGQGSCCRRSSSCRRASSGTWMTWPSCACVGLAEGGSLSRRPTFHAGACSLCPSVLCLVGR